MALTNMRAAPGFVIAVLGLAVALVGQQVQINPRSRTAEVTGDGPAAPDLRADTSLVLIPVAVTDEINRPITGLERENFRLLEDKVPQTISSFAMEDEPVALCLVFDASGSMGDALKEARQAASYFFRESNPGDQFCLVEFSDSPRLTVPLTDDPAHIRTELLMTKAKGSTALIDGVILGLQQLRKSKLSRRALVLVSDGGDNRSRYTASELHNIIRESDSLIFSIAVAGSDYDPGFMQRIAEDTGGRLFVAQSVSIVDVAKKIVIELRNRYILGYSSTNPARDGKFRKVEVQLKPPRGLPPLKAQWRRGYYAPQN
jgi:Ca-activated chloride channel homolog